MSKTVLQLYITGQSFRSEAAVSNLSRICREYVEEPYEIAIIDILEQPGAAERDNILATPTLVKCCPPPVRRIIGDLTSTDKVLAGLGLPVNQPRHPKGE